MLNKLSYSQQAEILFQMNVHRKLKLPSDWLKREKNIYILSWAKEVYLQV